MADPVPSPDPPLALRPAGPLWQIAGWQDFEAALAPLCATAGLPPPARGDAPGSYRRVAAAPGLTLLRVAPDRVWLRGAGAAALADRAAATPDRLVALDLSEGVLSLPVAGSRAGPLLARLAPVDLDPAVFPPGAFCQTAVHGVRVLIQCTGPAAFDLLVPRSWAESLCDHARAVAARMGPDP